MNYSKKIINVFRQISRLLLAILIMIVSTSANYLTQVHAAVVTREDWGYTILLKNPAYNTFGLNGYNEFPGVPIYNGVPAYCIEPLASIVENNDVYETGSVSEYNKLSESVKKRITEYSYFGYGYEGRSDHKYYVATQVLIHSAIDPVYLNFEKVDICDRNNGLLYPKEDITDTIKSYMREIESDVEAYEASLNEPNFIIKDSSGNVLGNEGSNVSAEVNVGDTITITDRNNAISKGKSIKENTFSNASITNNVITIKTEAKDIGEARKIVFKGNKDVADLGFRPIVLSTNDFQDLVVKGTIVAPKDASISLLVTGIDVAIKKKDADSKSLNQGDASLIGTEFTLYEEGSNKEIGKMIVKEDGSTNNLEKISASKSYRLAETKVNDGYKKKGDTVIKGEELIKGRNANNLYEIEVTNEIIRGGFKMMKKDKELNDNYGQGDAVDLSGEFEIINKSKYPVYLNNKEYKVNETLLTFTTDKDGLYESELILPYGTYLLKEKTPPLGYTNEGNTEIEFKIRNEEEIVDLTSEINNYVSRLNLEIQKRDYESKQTTAIGNASLEGAIFEIYNKSLHDIYYEDSIIKPDELIKSITTNKEGKARIDDLPYGTYLVKEVTAPIGYLNRGITEKMVELHDEDGVTISKIEEEDSILNEVIRGDFAIRKIDADNQNSMANIEFRITSNTTGEIHTFKTDENGYYSSESNWNNHSFNTNKGGSEDGLWFGEYLDEDGNKQLVEVNDEKGALPYDIYTIEELDGPSNKNKELFKGTLIIRRNNVTVNLYNIENKDKPKSKDIEIKTMATDKNGEKVLKPEEEVIIIDTVNIKNVSHLKGKMVLLEGSLIDKETGGLLQNSIDGVISTKVFEINSDTQEEVIEFKIDGSKLDGKEVVVYEKLYLITLNEKGDIVEEELIAVHEDINDKDQTVTFSKEPTPKTYEKPKPRIPNTSDEIHTNIYATILITSLCLFRYLLKIKMKYQS